MMKRPSDEILVKQALDEFSGTSLSDLFADLFTNEEMRQILIENMSGSQLRGWAQEEWDALCEQEERNCNTHISPAGGYWL